MKRYLLLIISVLFTPYAFCQATAAPAPADFVKLTWLQGEWNRVNIKSGHSGHERWIKITDHELNGWGVTMKGTDTAFVEKLKLVVKDNRIFYVADTPGNKEPVYFTLTSLKQMPYRSFGINYTWKFGKLEFKRQRENEDVNLTNPPGSN